MYIIVHTSVPAPSPSSFRLVFRPMLQPVAAQNGPYNNPKICAKSNQKLGNFLDQLWINPGPPTQGPKAPKISPDRVPHCSKTAGIAKHFYSQEHNNRPQDKVVLIGLIKTT